MQDADIEATGNRRRVREDQIVRNVALPKTLAVKRDIEMWQPEGLGFARRKHADVGRQSQPACDLIFRVVIAIKEEDGDIGVRQPTHLLHKEKAGLIVAPIAVIEVAGDNDEIDLLLDRLADEIVEGHTRCCADPFGSRALLPGNTAHRNPMRLSSLNGPRTTIYVSSTRWEIPGLTPQGSAGLVVLASQLDGFGPGTSPWTLLTTWLFERSGYLKSRLTANDAKSQQQLVAIYQLLKVCGEMAADGDSTRKHMLARVRRIEALNDDRMYRAVASEASDLNGVRVLTVHGSKGLEFRAVHLPALATRYMPANRQGVRCPPPPSLPHLAIRPADHEAEEECLFFVALSRARDFLFLSRAERYSASQSASASKFLSPINALAPAARRNDSPLPSRPTRPLAPSGTRTFYQERELSLYIQCPQRYQFEALDGLRAIRDDSPYVRFHRCVFRTIGWLETQRAAGTPSDLPAALAQLAQEWGGAGRRDTDSKHITVPPPKP